MIAIYNGLVDATSRIDQDGLVPLRDALAQGRVAFDGHFPVKLVKFRRIRTDWVRVERAEDMTVDWFGAQVPAIDAALATVGNSQPAGTV